MSLPPVTGVELLIINEPVVVVTTSPLVTTGGLTDQSHRLHFGDSPGGLGGTETTSFTSMLRQRGVANVALKIAANDNYTPTEGCQVFLYDLTATTQKIVFVGTIDNIDWSWWGEKGDRLAALSCVSLEQTFDVIRVPGTLYQHQTAGAIFANILLLAVGWPGTVGRIDEGPLIDTFLIENNPSMSELFSKLAQEAGFVWDVNINDLTINFHEPAIEPAPFTLLQADVIYEALDLKKDRHDYRNRQTIAITYDSIGRSAELFIGAGQTSFSLRNPVHTVTNAWITKNLQNTAIGTFTGQPAEGDYVTISYPKAGSSYNWAPNAPYSSRQFIVDPLSHLQEVITGGTSGAVEPTWNDIGGPTSDNTVRWQDRGNAGFGPYQVARYTFTAEIDNTIFGLVLIGATAEDTCKNLIDAINSKTDTRGIKYSLPTWENPLINADAPDMSGLSFTIRDKGATAGSIAALDYNSTAFSWDGPATSGGLTTFGTYSISVGIAAANVQGLSFTPGSNIVTLQSPLNAGTNLQVEYQRIDGQLISVEDTSLVIERAAIEHSTGKYQALMSDNTGASPVQGLNEALSALRAFDVIPEYLNFQTFRPGLRINQALSVDFSFPGGPDLLVGSEKGAYKFRRTITINPSDPPTELHVVPSYTMLFKGVYAYLATIPNGGECFNTRGYDIIFTTDPNGREMMNWEITSYDETTGDLMFWILWPEPLDRLFPSTFYMFYGNPGIKSFQSAGGAFPHDYYGVYHMREVASPYRDSSDIRNDATGDTDPLEVAGLFGPAQRFRISGPNTLKMATIPVAGDFGGIGLTVEFWINAADTTNIQMIVDTGYGQLKGTQVYIENGGTLRVFDVNTGSTAATPDPVADSTWHYIVAVNDSLGFINIWVDTIHVTNFTSFGTPAAQEGTTAIGIGKGDLHPFDGILEEFRFATHSVLQQRVDADFRNQNPGTIEDFYSIGEPTTWGLAPWIIQEVDAELIPTRYSESLGSNQYGEYGRWRYTVRCVNSSQIGSYIDFWLGLGGSGGGLADSSSGVTGTAFPSQASTGNSISVAQGGIVIGAQPILNFIEGSGVSFLIGNDPGDSRVNITISANVAVFITYGKYADLPPVLGTPSGMLYFFKDSIYTHAYFNDVDWIIFADGRQMFVPSKKPWIGGTAVVDIDNGFSTMLILSTFSPPQTWQFQWASIGYPTGAAYDFTAGFRLTTPLIGTETGVACLFFSNGHDTVLYGIFSQGGQWNITVQTSSSFNGVDDNSVVMQEVVPISTPIIWLRVAEDGAHNTFWWSADKVRWQIAYKDDTGWFLAATSIVGWGGKQGLEDLAHPHKLGTGTFVDLVSFEGNVGSTYTFTTTTTAIGAGTPTRELTITTTAITSGTVTITPDDMGAGGIFYPTSVTIPAGAAGQHVGFVYIADIARTADVTITANATGGGAYGVGAMLLPIGTDTLYAHDNFVGTALAPVLGRTPDAGAAWTRPYNPGDIDLILDGSGGCYADGSGASPFSKVFTLAIDRTKCGTSNLTNFPVLIHATDNSLKTVGNGGSVTSSSGYDIVVGTNTGFGTYLPWEVEHWDGTTGEIWFWAKIPSVNGSAAGSNTQFAIAWGNAAITTQQNTGSFAATNVWDSNYKMVLHFGSPSGTLSLNDSTSNGNNANDPFPGQNTLSGTTILDGCLFATSSGGLQILSPTGFPTGASTFTMSCWANASNAGPTKYMFAIGAGTGANHAMVIAGQSSAVIAGLFTNELATGGSESGVNYVVCTYDGTAQHVYLNGVEVSGSPNTQTANIDQSLGSSIGTFIDGNVDEARVSNIARSSDWILSEYHNQINAGGIGSPSFLIWTEIVPATGPAEYQIPTSAPQLINDVMATYTSIDTSVLQPSVAMFGDAGAYESGYVLYSDPTGVGASAWVAGTETQFTAPTGSALTGDHQLRIAVRLINNHQFVFFLVDGVMLTGAPWQDNSVTTGYASLIPVLNAVPSSTDTVCTEISGSNADWSV